MTKARTTRGITPRPNRDGTVSWRVQIRRRGFPSRYETFTRKADALAFQAKAETEINEGAAAPLREAKRKTVADAIDKYLAAVIAHRRDKSARGHFRFWREHLGAARLSAVTAANVAELRDELAATITRLGGPMSPATVKLHIESLSALFKYAIRELRWTQNNPCAHVTRPRPADGRVRYLDDGERKRLLEACKVSAESRLYPFVVLALSTGARAGELLLLRWRDVDQARGVATLHKTKSGDRRALSIKGVALDQLKELYGDGRDADSTVFGNAVNPRFDYQDSFTAAKAAAGIENFRFHDLRHSAASYLVMNGATVSEVAAVLGHRTLQMVQRYAHLSDSHVGGVVERMNEKIFGAGDAAK